MTISVLLVDDQPLLSLGFRLVLEAQPDFTVVGEAGDGAQAVGMTRALEPDVVLMDVRMPVMDGIAATRAIVEGGRSAKVLVLTTFDLDEYVYAALRAGASGFLLKDVPPADLLSAVRAVAGGHAVVAPAVTRRLLEKFAPMLPAGPVADQGERLRELLTAREREVLELVARGLSNTEIAGELTLSEATVKAHVGRLLAKLQLRDRVQIVIFAYENGIRSI
ncbi:response regulator transcription factor [Actinoplanes sp. LDG1-06]|uniref:Response regulator transcription factor n=1 Tax=Paractinoplanes ovalisporus TaxID=2810368 RepID=A0ABS2A9V6_9ACTN|nr:response regulator transcription factor [Actinoplanes ovalisporus]MBM2616619.1 response regulator transcription factor [Actinoplanes ovalisporus]